MSYQKRERYFYLYCYLFVVLLEVCGSSCMVLRIRKIMQYAVNVLILRKNIFIGFYLNKCIFQRK